METEIHDNTYPRMSLSNNNSPDRKTTGQIYKSDTYNELLKRPGEVIIPVKGQTTQKHPLINMSHNDQSLPKDTENTTGLLEAIITNHYLCILQCNSLPTHGLLN